jgi:putative capsular polysaccharide biosynthesis protein
MIDIHSHLIPNVDDGAKSPEETIELIKEAREAGITDIILTPHYIINSYEQNAETLILLKDKLQQIINSENIKVNLHIGMEVYITDNLVEILKQNKILTLAGSKYLLMELPLNTNVQYLDMVIFKLIENNIIPIIAHPERYKFVQEDPSKVRELIESGCLIQSNIGSILGIYGKKAKKTIKYLLKNDLINFIATDTHRKNTIYPLLEKGIKKIEKITGKEKAEELTNLNVQKILNNT